MAHKFDPKKKDKLDNEWRRTILPPKNVLLDVGLTSEDDLADIGCGIGYFTIEAARMLGKGKKAYALDISEEMLNETMEKAESEGLENIVPVKTEEYELKLDDETASFALAVNVIHEVEDKNRLIREIKRILKNNGKLAVIEFEKTEMDMGPPLEHRISQREMVVLLEEEGFYIKDSLDFSKTFYGITAVKKEL